MQSRERPLQQRQSGRERNVAWQPVPYITLSEKVERFGDCRRGYSPFFSGKPKRSLNHRSYFKLLSVNYWFVGVTASM
jgi:hypothetical protein